MSSGDAISSAVGAPQSQSDLELWPQTVVLLQSVVTQVHTNPSGHSDSDTVCDDVLCSVFSGDRNSIPHSVC